MYALTLFPLVYGEYWAPLIIFCIALVLMRNRLRLLVDVPKATLLLIGLLVVGGLSYQMTGRITEANFLRDFLIVLNIILLYVSGYWMGRISWDRFVEALKFSSACYSFFYLIKFGYLLTTAGIDIGDAQSYRLQMGAGEFIVAIGLYVYIADFKRHSLIIPAVLVTVALLTQSRTLILYLIILSTMAVNFRTYRSQRRLFLLFISAQVIVVSGVLYFLFLSYTSALPSPQGDRDLMEKLQASLVEILPAYYYKSEVGYFWRGFETYVALEVFKDSSTYQSLFGRGMGFAIPLPYEMTLAGNSFIELPFLHNGYATVLVKFGVVGLFLYATFLLVQLRVALKDDLATLYSATVLFTIFATLIMAGPFEKNDFTHVTLLLGALYGRSSAARVTAKRAARCVATGTLQMQRL